MRRSGKVSIFSLALAALVACGLGATGVYAEGFEHHRGWLGPFGAVVKPDQRQRIATALASERATMHSLHDHVRAARAALITKLLSSDQNVDVTNEVKKLEQAENALLAERIKVAKEVRVLLSAQQREQALALWNKLENLHQQERDLLEQAHGEARQP